MKNKIWLLPLLALCLGGGYWWLGAQSAQQTPAAQAAIPPPVAEKPAMPAPSNMLGAIDVHHFELDDLLARWKSATPKSAENPDEALIFESLRNVPIPADSVKNLVRNYTNINNPTLKESLEVVSALSFCERRVAYGETPDAAAGRSQQLPDAAARRSQQLQEEYATYCADLEDVDYLENKNIMRSLIQAGYIEAKLMYYDVGPLGKRAAEEEIINAIGEDAARQWLDEAIDHLLDYARDGGSRPDIAYSVLAAMHGGFAEKPPAGSVFGEQFDAEKAYAYEYLRAAALIAHPPPAAPPEVARQIQENCLQSLRRMEGELTPEQINAARRYARGILDAS